MKTLATYHFDSPFAFTKVDRANGIIRDVSLITSGVKARGHELETDDTTLKQMQACASARGKVPVKLNHQSGVENVCGYVTNVRILGAKLLGDWHLLKSHAEFEAMMEKAERMPECFGLSAAFMGEAELKDGTPKARCTELLAVDCVAQPAANPSGLFSARTTPPVDTQTTGMETNPNDVPAEMPAWFKPFAEQLQQISAFQQQQQQQALADHLLQMSPEDRAALSDADLAQWGITRDEVAEIDAIAAQMTEGAENGGTEGAPAGTESATATGNAAPARSGTTPAGPAQGNTASSAVTSAAVASLQAEIRKLQTFQTKIERAQLNELQRREEAERDQALTTLEEKTSALLVELQAKDEVIKRFEEAGTRVPASREGVNLFSAKAGDGKSTEFQILCSARFEELKTAHPAADAKKLKLLEAQAIRETVKTHKAAYFAHREHAITLERR